MAGIYVHIPFCRQACRYCDFFFTVSLKYRDDYVSALLKELLQRQVVLRESSIDTIYLGGGTPSVLSEGHLHDIMETIFKNHSITEGAEITIEANPDDLTDGYIRMLKKLGINRLSVGIQSFRDKDLELMRRSHTAGQALDAIEISMKNGFKNISLDLIYGLPELTPDAWEENINIAMKLPIDHISAYHLTYEPGTVFSHWKKQQKIVEIPEQASIDQYNILRKITKDHGFDHYEISNFAREGFRSKHNSTYWSGETYVGYGPSAHSYNGRERRWNISSLKGYIEKVNQNQCFFESEILTLTERFHDYLITSLRTKWGASIDHIARQFGDNALKELIGISDRFMKSNDLLMENGVLRMTAEGWLKSDLILSEFMITIE